MQIHSQTPQNTTQQMPKQTQPPTQITTQAPMQPPTQPPTQPQIGQLFMVGFDGFEANEHIIHMIQHHHIGGVILFRRNVKSPEQVNALCLQLQTINAAVNTTPLLIAIDQEGGMVMRLEHGVTPQPSAMAYQAAGSVELCEKMHQISADELGQMGINFNLAPVLDVNNNPLNPVIGVRSFGEDVATVNRFGGAALRGLKAGGILRCAKHFPGHGDTSTDSHIGSALVPHVRERLDAIELAPFKAAIEAQVEAIMTAHVIFPAIESEPNLPATLSKKVLTGLLRNALGFTGLIITDCMEMAAIASTIGVTQGTLATLQAGADMVLISHLQERQVEAILAVQNAVQTGQIDKAIIDAANANIAHIKNQNRVKNWAANLAKPLNLKQAQSLKTAQTVHQLAVQTYGNLTPINRQLPIKLITIEVLKRTEIDEAVLTLEGRSSMLTALQRHHVDVQEIAISPDVTSAEMAAFLDFINVPNNQAQTQPSTPAPQVILQTYNAVLFEGQQKLLNALPHANLWLVAGRLPYDLHLANDVKGRLTAFGCRPAALAPIVDKLLGVE